MLRSMVADINPEFGHCQNRARIDSVGRRSRRAGLESVDCHGTQQSFSHLATAGVARAEKQDLALDFHGAASAKLLHSPGDGLLLLRLFNSESASGAAFEFGKRSITDWNSLIASLRFRSFTYAMPFLSSESGARALSG